MTVVMLWLILLPNGLCALDGVGASKDQESNGNGSGTSSSVSGATSTGTVKISSGEGGNGGNPNQPVVTQSSNIPSSGTGDPNQTDGTPSAIILTPVLTPESRVITYYGQTPGFTPRPGNNPANTPSAGTSSDVNPSDESQNDAGTGSSSGLSESTKKGLVIGGGVLGGLFALGVSIAGVKAAKNLYHRRRARNNRRML